MLGANSGLLIYRDVQKLPENLDENGIFAVFDVGNLYSNISHDLGLDAIDFRIDKSPDELPNTISKDFIIDSIKRFFRKQQLLFQ